MTDLATTDHQGMTDAQRVAILDHLKLNPNSVDTQALLLICQRYDLDPLLKHVVLIQGRPYVTRDGYLAVAHRSGQLDGIEIQDAGDDKDCWWAKVSVYRKDMSRPFTYVGRYPKADAKHMAKYGPEMAIKCGEVMALRRAFNVTGIGAADEQWDDHSVPVDPWHALGWADEAEHDLSVAEVVEEAKGLPEAQQTAVKEFLKENNWGRPYRREWVESWMGKIEELTPEADDHEPLASRPIDTTADPTLLDADEGRPFE
jgi:hypothetical protein